MTEEQFKITIEQLLINRTKRKGDPSWMKTSILGYAKSYAAAQVAAKDARIQELELLIEYAASSLDLIHPDDSDFMEKLNKIYQNLENKTRFEV